MPSNPGIVIDIPTPTWTYVRGGAVDKWTSSPDIGKVLRVDVDNVITFYGTTVNGGSAGGHDNEVDAQTATALQYAIEDFWAYVKNNPVAQGVVEVTLPIDQSVGGTAGVLTAYADNDANAWIREYAFTGGRVYFTWEVPPDIDDTKDVKFQVVGVVMVQNMSSDSVKFNLQGYAVDNGADLDGTFGANDLSEITGQSSSIGYRIQTELSSGCSISGLAAGKTVQFKLTRDSSDTFGGTVGVVALKLTYYKA